ncbi:hypothetical protein FJT64_007090 [Amphibalanus amphitrite]|uniref:Uncharacterized protein n=1 Tax=Amphibalanus amphitrite TaxID=1232801 RepID=A0A6A4VFZ0_AMPAM|nr:hypothetical protein FJT64_007090 [Amphibalanus amphitrite]
MFHLLVVSALTLLGAAEPAFQGDPSTAAILADTRRLRADGGLDVAYAQEDGVLFKETTSGDGERRGSYQFVGDDGKEYRVEYTAGAGGFQVISSTHVDSTPNSQAPAQPAPTERYQQPARTASRPVTEKKSFSSFSLSYDSSEPLTPVSAVTAPPPRRTTTTTTTQRPVRKNFHNGKVSLERDNKGYVYTYSKTD